MAVLQFSIFLFSISLYAVLYFITFVLYLHHIWLTLALHLHQMHYLGITFASYRLVFLAPGWEFSNYDDPVNVLDNTLLKEPDLWELVSWGKTNMDLPSRKIR